MKKLIISHVADIDGLDAVVLAKLAYEDIDYILVEFAELNGVNEKIAKVVIWILILMAFQI
ncbi:MAG TPA: hypothetical protein PLT65_01510 [Bacilli bacterium]|nr:hypothetical protein [Bacilli bacterium]